jgi:hypothetical protein
MINREMVLVRTQLVVVARFFPILEHVDAGVKLEKTAASELRKSVTTTPILHTRDLILYLLSSE